MAAPLGAQQATDSLPSRVPLARVDSTASDSVRRDTVQPPLAVAPRPGAPEISGRRVRWDRTAIFVSGALTLPELLAQVPGATVYHAGHIAAPTATAWYGEPGRVRVWLDGVALDPLDPREGGVHDLAVIQLWSLEEVSVERLAGELRVHLRSWRVDRTTSQTRTDVQTGSEDTNLYRGFFGKRLRNGGVLQVAAQQYSTSSVRMGGDGDALAGFMRLGWAGGGFTFDAVGNRVGRARFPTKRYLVSGTPEDAAIGGFTGRDHSGYLRAAWRDPDSSGVWVQVLAASLAHYERGDTAVVSDTLPPADTAVSASQYVMSFGVNRGALSLAATGRMRVRDGVSRVAPELRAAWSTSRLAVGASLEFTGPDSTNRTEGSILLTPWSWLRLGAALSTHSGDASSGPGRQLDVSRVEAATHYRGYWLRAGMVQRGGSLSPGMPVFDSLYAPVLTPASTGLEAGVSGPLWGPFSFDWRGIRWSDEVMYRPFVESRAEIRVRTALERYLTRRAFNLDAAIVHEYRGYATFPGPGGTIARAEGAGYLGGTLEIRIGNARVFWYNRNMTAKIYETVPGYLMPRLIQVYGLRWEFWN